MDVKTYRAKTMQEALAMVRRDLGPNAAVLHTRHVRIGGLLSFLPGARRIEVVASDNVNVPSRFPTRTSNQHPSESLPPTLDATGQVPPLSEPTENKQNKPALNEDIKVQLAKLQSMVENLYQRSGRSTDGDLPGVLFEIYTDLIEVEIQEDLAREIVESIRRAAPSEELQDADRVKERLIRMIEKEITVSGPIAISRSERRIVALVGPTGVGKTTTIAKLAANYRLREKRKVGLITVDTYRIAAVEQLRTYADIIDLPMEVVSTPKEMRQAVERLSDQELILIDTAGRSPRDEVKIQELKAFLTESQADEVHLVLSTVASANSLAKTAEQFCSVGTTSLLLTKLDEAIALGNVLPMLRSTNLPISYLTNGQNVPDDIEPANRRHLVHMILNMDTSRKY